MFTANENEHLLKDILRDEWGFEGSVITDWGASNDHSLGVKNGSTLEMPTPGLDAARELLASVESGKISEKDIDERVDELLDLVLTTTENAKHYKKVADKKSPFNGGSTPHHKLARLACENSAVLLKNEDGILPVGAKVQAAVIGDFAFDPRYQGAGSSMVNSTKVDSIKDMLETSGISVTGIVRGYQRDGKEDEAMKKEAVDLARRSDVVLFFFGLNEKSETEGLDRKHLRIPQNQINLIQELAKANANMIGIISAGSVIEMPWHHHFKALLHTALMGQAGAGAVLDILSGKVNPSGSLLKLTLRNMRILLLTITIRHRSGTLSTEREFT